MRAKHLKPGFYWATDLKTGNLRVVEVTDFLAKIVVWITGSEQDWSPSLFRFIRRVPTPHGYKKVA